MDEASNRLNDIPWRSTSACGSSSARAATACGSTPSWRGALKHCGSSGKTSDNQRRIPVPAPQQAGGRGGAEPPHGGAGVADVIVPFSEQAAVEIFARRAGFTQVIAYGKRNFMHLGLA